MTTKPDLDALLQRLAGLTDVAQKRYERERRDADEADDDPDWEAEEDVWLTLEQDFLSRWQCGWRVRQDEATVWVFKCQGLTPVEAAQDLLREIQKDIRHV